MSTYAERIDLFLLKFEESTLLQGQNSWRCYDLILGLFVCILIVSNIASTKIVELGPFTFDGGTILFPISYIFGDVLTEVYGYAGSRRAIWSGFFALTIFAVVILVVGWMKPAPEWNNQAAYTAILMTAPRITLASIIAYFCGEFSNSLIMSKMKIKMQAKHLWMRTIGSTIVGEAVDSVVFVTVAFAFVLPNSLLISIMISNYIFKTFYEIIATPLTYIVVNALKRIEKVETFDRNISYSPFKLKF